jgi:ribosomal protein S18 acetylase RimI-like enzyme
MSANPVWLTLEDGRAFESGSFGVVKVARRPVVPADRDTLRLIHHRAYREVVELQFGPWDDGRQDRYFGAGWDDASHEAILYGGEVAGYCSIEPRDADIHIRELVIDPRFQNLGIGSTIIKQAMGDAEKRGVPVVLGTLIANRAAKLYERLGFTEFDRTDTHRLFKWSPPRPSGFDIEAGA